MYYTKSFDVPITVFTRTTEEFKRNGCTVVETKLVTGNTVGQPIIDTDGTTCYVVVRDDNHQLVLRDIYCLTYMGGKIQC